MTAPERAEGKWEGGKKRKENVWRREEGKREKGGGKETEKDIR